MRTYLSSRVPVVPAEARQPEPSSTEEDLAQVVIDAHSGDAVAALRTVIADAAFLHDQLETASALIVRDWKPKFQREA